MANVTSTQTLVDGPRNYVVKFEGILDTSDLGSTIVIDFSTLNNESWATQLRIDKIQYNIEDTLTLNLLWDATADVRICQLTGRGEFDATGFGGLQNNAGAGKTGDVLATTQGWSASAILSFSVILECTKQ